MRIIFLFFILFLSVFITQLVAQEVTITGKVTDSEFHLPMMGAIIQLDSVRSVTTDANGQFSFAKVKTGLHHLSATYLGYVTHQQHTQALTEDMTVNIGLIAAPHEINEVVITGTGTPHYLKNAPVLTEVFSQKALSSYSGHSIEDILGGLSPAFNFSSNAMGSFMHLNGLGNDYILVLLNGKRLYGDVGSQNDLSRIDPSNIERIEIVKGASSSLYGSDAIAGVVNIITKKSSNPLSANNITRIGSYGEWMQTNTLAINRKKLQLATHLSHSQSNGWQNSPYEIDKNGTPENPLDDRLVSTHTMTKNPMMSNGFKQGITHQTTNRLTLSADAEFSFREVTPPVKAKGYRFLYHNQSLGVGTKFLYRSNGFLSLDATYDRFRYLYRYDMKYNVNVTNANDQSEFITYYPGDRSLNNDQQKLTVNAKSSYKPNARHNIVSGIECETEWMEAPYRLKNNSVNGYVVALYAQDELTLTEAWVVTAGARLLHHNQFGQKLTPKIASLYKLGNINLRGTYAYGFKTPTLKELNYRYEREDMGAYRLYLGNQDLKPQTSNYYSAAVEYNCNWLTISLTAYRNHLNDMIEYRAITTSRMDAERGVEETKQYDNIANARIQGIDAIVNVTIGKHWSLGSGYSYADALNITQQCRLNGSLLHHANFKCEWNATWPAYKLNIALFGDALSNQFGDALSDNYYDQQMTDSYMLWKINTIHRFSIHKQMKMEGALGIDNVLNYVDDKPYGSNHCTTTPGRTYYVSLNIKFSN